MRRTRIVPYHKASRQEKTITDKPRNPSVPTAASPPEMQLVIQYFLPSALGAREATAIDVTKNKAKPMQRPAAPSPPVVRKTKSGKRLLVALAVIGAVWMPADARAQAVSYEPGPLFEKALAADRKGGLELFAIARYRAYLAAAPKAGNARRVRERIVKLEVEVEAKVRELLNKAGAAAAQLPDGDNRIQAFRRIAAVLAGAGDMAGAGKIAASLPSADDREFVFMNIAIAKMRNGDFKGAMAVIAGIENAFFASSARREIAWVQAYSGDVAGAWKTADSVSGDQVKSWAYVRIADAEFIAGNAPGAQKAIASAKKAASRIPLEVVKSYSYARIVEAQVRGNDLPGAGATAVLVSYGPVRARVDGLIANARPETNPSNSTIGRDEIDAWSKIVETRLNKQHFVDFQAFWQSLRNMDTNEIIEALLTASSDFIDALNVLRETEMLWWTRRAA